MDRTCAGVSAERGWRRVVTGGSAAAPAASCALSNGFRFAMVLAAVLAVACVHACGRGGEGPRDSGPLRIVVTIAPLTGLVKELAPAEAEIRTLIPPGRSLHGHEMTPGDLAALAKADVVVYVGLGLEPAAAKFLADRPSKRRREVCFADVVGIKAEPDEPHHEHADEAGRDDSHDDGHDHGLVDPHLWLDPDLVAMLIPAVRGAIEAAMREQGTSDQAALDQLSAAEKTVLARVAEIDREYRSRLAPLKGASCVTHHNAFGRLAARYGLEIAAVIRPLESLEPTPGQIAEAVGAIREHGARAVFFEPQFDESAARMIAEGAGVRLGRLDPEGNTDWFALMRGNLDELVRLLSP